MTARASAPSPRRNRGFEGTHDELIEAAVRLISEKGVEALSVAALARAVGINRTTVYYHFADRDALIAAVKLWASQQLVSAFRTDLPQAERIDHITRFVLDNPDLIKLWIEDFVSPGDIRKTYPHWDALVDGIRARFASEAPDEQGDAEIYCTILLTSAIIGPRVFRNAVRPDASTESIVERFRKEQQRLLRHDALFHF